MDGGGEDGHRPSEERAAKFVGLGLILEPCPKLQQDRAQQAAFLSAVSHEMKTPLASIRAYAELLADGDAEDPATREEFFQVINTQVDRLQRLVQNLLDLARIEAGIMQVQKRTLSLNEILEEAAEVVRPTAAAKSLRLQTELSPLFLPVCVDRDLMLQAAINLLSNAIKYTPSGGQITLRSRLADDQVIFQVEDTGVGLTEEECARIFERFYRVKRNEKLAEGTGLGLALVKSIVEELHGGQISVESSVGKGTTFTVRLPAVHQAAAA
jgi:two-component system phosphate regulon sensor histidine kinase PhoR